MAIVIFTRVMAGDQSLIEVINANAASQAPVQQAYRSALAQEPVSPVLDEICLGRKREREDLLFELEIAEHCALFAGCNSCLAVVAVLVLQLFVP